MQLRPVQSKPSTPAIASGAVSPNAGGAKGPQDGFSQAEQAEWKDWKDRLRPELGQLGSAPTGTLETARSYVEQVLARVAGEDLKGMNVRVEVFSGDIPQ